MAAGAETMYRPSMAEAITDAGHAVGEVATNAVEWVAEYWQPLAFIAFGIITAKWLWKWGDNAGAKG